MADGGVYHGGDRVLFGDITKYEQGFAAGFVYHSGGFFAHIAIEVSDNDAGFFAGERQRNGSPNTLAGAGDETDFICK
ncbi:hypothetical protein GCM10007052_01190 [Halioglobus japonicus]|nr:hypothetical protein GCM10007052_01190 [Halioglobus japonicus]